MLFRFTKMNGLGNDFIIIDAINQNIHLDAAHISQLADRHTGIGFDQCLLVERSQQANIDFFYRIFNANGQEVGQCGNGARCLARFVTYYGLTHKKEFRVATKTTQMSLKLNPDDTVSVDMGIPNWAPKHIPLLVDTQADTYTIQVDNESLLIHSLSVGNPHAVVVVNDLAALNENIATLGKTISEHSLFPEQCNASFMQILDETHIQLRVYERDCGETLACGSAAVAAAAVARRFYQAKPSMRVILPGGELTVDWPNQQAGIQLTGPATFVYEGVIHPCAL